MTEFLKQFGERVALQREKRGWSQRDLLRKIRRQRGQDDEVKGNSLISNWEKGAHGPGIDTVMELAGLFGVDPRWLAYGDENPARTLSALKIAGLLEEHARTLRNLYPLLQPTRTEAPAGLENIVIPILEDSPRPVTAAETDWKVFTEDELPPMQTLGVAVELRIAAGRPLLDITDEGEFAYNGARYLVARVRGDSMSRRVYGQRGILTGDRIVLELMNPEPRAEPTGQGLTDRQGVRDGEIYLVEVESRSMRGLMLKRVDVTDTGIILSTDCPAEWGGRRLLSIGIGDTAIIKARMVGFLGDPRQHRRPA